MGEAEGDYRSGKRLRVLVFWYAGLNWLGLGLKRLDRGDGGRGSMFGLVVYRSMSMVLTLNCVASSISPLWAVMSLLFWVDLVQIPFLKMSHAYCASAPAGKDCILIKPSSQQPAGLHSFKR
jgi:hypothetical protein